MIKQNFTPIFNDFLAVDLKEKLNFRPPSRPPFFQKLSEAKIGINDRSNIF